MTKRKDRGDAVAQALKAADAGPILKGFKWATLLQLSC